MVDSIDKIISLCKRRGFIFPGSEIYGGLANSWDYGPLGVELKNNIRALWWERFVHRREDMVGIEAALIMNPKVWEVSGHLKSFIDPVVECKVCGHRFRYDAIVQTQIQNLDGTYYCPYIEVSNIKGSPIKHHGKLSQPMEFNLLLKTFIGIESIENTVYLRPETAQAMFVDFKNVLDTSRKTLPFGIAQIGKAFRNEITPGNFIFRTREFEQMEIEYFINEGDWEGKFEHWRLEMWSWITDVMGIKQANVHEIDIPDGERAHYSKKTIDFEYDYPFGRKELCGLAYRTDFDLKNHFKEAPYKDQETGEQFYPHVIEPAWGVDRSVLAVLCDAYEEEEDRIVLKLKPKLAPYKVAVFPLLKNKPELVGKAKEIYWNLKKEFTAAWDDRGNVGKRYYSQDEIGTPYCVTIDFQTLEDKMVTVRDRDTMKQERVAINDLVAYLKNAIQ